MNTSPTAVEADLLNDFYRIPRAGAVRLSDGGGPFGFDITVALQVDHLINTYDCDGIVETGCFLGDTTEFLARHYPHLPVRTCDIDDHHASFTRSRVAALPNAAVFTGDSADLLTTLSAGLHRPLVYLDAHWNQFWPLQHELRSLHTAVVCIDDFDIGHPRFGFDTYKNLRCGPDLIADTLPDLPGMWVGNPYAQYPLPCLQTGRRSGTGFLILGSAQPITHPMFLPVPLHPVRLPDWDSIETRTEGVA